MAWGDWVRTYAGALRRGAQAIIGGILSAGGNPASAYARLSALFPRLGGSLINLIVGNVTRQAGAALRVFESQGTQTLPDWLHQARADLPQLYRYNVLVTYTDPRTGRQLRTTSVIESGEALSWFEITGRAQRSILERQRDRRARYQGDPILNQTRAPVFLLRASYKRS
jgi:hypothetical protein